MDYIPFTLIVHYFALVDWLPNLAPLFQPMRSKIKTNRDLCARVFPRFMLLLRIFMSSLCFLRLFWFLIFIALVCFNFTTLNSKQLNVHINCIDKLNALSGPNIGQQQQTPFTKETNLLWAFFLSKCNILSELFLNDLKCTWPQTFFSLK